MCTTPWWITRFSPRRLNVFFLFGRFPVSGAVPCIASALAMGYTVFFFAMAPRRGPFRVRALVCVR